MAKANKSKREMREAQRRRKQTRNLLILGGALVFALVVIGLLAFRGTGTVKAMGDAVPVDSRDHIPEGQDPGPYPTDPPAGGKHYAQEAKAGFYTEADAANVKQYQAGYLVHSLEHGYIIFWYNCDANPQINCNDLQQTIRQVMDQNKGFKMIAFPWKSLKEPLVMTSWGRILRLDQPDAKVMNNFYKANLNQAPEPNAD